MSTEQRVMVGGRRPLSEAAGRGGAPKPEETPEPPAKKSKKKLLVIGVVALLAAAAAAYFLFLKPAPADAAEAHEPEPVELGEVMPVDAVSLNLANGRYLRLGFALQLTAGAGAHGPLDTARALDQAIALFSGRDIAEVTDPAVRDQLTAELAHQLEETYHGEVVDVYLTEYVTQ
jgi:flagellar protein FliL